MKNMVASKCIVDIVSKSEFTGFTLRPFEAMNYKKKLITNNPDLANYDFYNKENIFIFGKDSESRLKDFVRSPFVEIPQSIRLKYDINSWIQNYLPK